MMRLRSKIKFVPVILLVLCATLLVSTPAGAARVISTQQPTHRPGKTTSYGPGTQGQSAPSHNVNLVDVPQVKGKVYPIPDDGGDKAPNTPPIPAPKRGATILPIPTNPAASSTKQHAKSQSTPYPSVSPSFQGISDTGWAPSDSMSAVSPTNLVETVNEQFSVYDRAGTVHYSTDLHTLFGITGSTAAFDPRVAYDTWGNRFVMVADTSASLLLAVSSDRTGLTNWCQYTFPTLPGFLDYPMMGMDAHSIYLAANDNGAYNNEIIKIDRTSLESSCGGTPTWTYWANIPDAEGAAGYLFINPIVETVRDGSKPEYMISSHWWGDCNLTLWTVTNTTLTTQLVPTGCFTPATANPVQQGTTANVDSGGAKIIGASYLNGVISTGLTTDYDWGSGNHKTAAYWWQILPNGTVKQEKIVGNPAWWYYYPNFQQDENGNTVMVLNTSTTYSYINTWFYAFDPAGNSVGNNGLVWGTGPYGTDGTTTRWGDLNSAMIDPRGPGTTVWVCSQYAASNNQWGTWNAQIAA